MRHTPQETERSETQARNADEHRQRIKHTIDKAEKYRKRKTRKHKAEMDLIQRVLPQLKEVRTILDAPCGVGRATVMLARAGYAVTGIDLGDGALQLARQAVEEAQIDAVIEKQDMVALDYADGQFDAVLCFRLIHHLPTPHHRREIIAELCRVADRYVLISYLSPWSYTSTNRWLKKKLGGKPDVQHVTSLREISGYFSEQGFVLVSDLAQTPFIHSLHLALFARKDIVAA